jgi:hypothetical protein
MSAFQNINITGRKVPVPAVGALPPFALRTNAGGGGKAGKPTGVFL